MKRIVPVVVLALAFAAIGIGLTSAGATTTQTAILSAAASQAGVAYCDGGGGIDGPTHGVGTPQGGCNGTTVGFDCMSLVQYAVYQGTGGQVIIPDSGSPDVDGGQVISEADLEPGDAVFMGGPGSLADYAHSAIYAGNGMIWDDYTENEPVQMRTLASIQNPTGPYLFDGGVRWNTTVSTTTTVPPTTTTTTTSTSTTTTTTTTAPPAPLALTVPAHLPNATEGTAYSYTMTAKGGTKPYTWSLQKGNKLAAGLTLSTSGVLSGTPTVGAQHNIKIEVSDGSTTVKGLTKLRILS
jgi:hypothetical protein